MYIGDWLARREMLSPDKVALVDAQDGYRPLTYREWNRSANRTANYLASLGIKQGDLVAMLSMNCVAYLDIWFACGKLGAILQGLNWRLAPRELVGVLREATPRMLIYGPDFVPCAREIRTQVDGIAEYVALDPGVMIDPSDHVLSEREEQPDSPPPELELTWDTPWALCYTGGTTGVPKGAILTHGTVTWNSVNTVMSWGLRPDDITVLNAPLFHTGGLNVFTAPLVHIGGTSIVCRTFDVDQVFDLIEHRGLTLWFGVPTMFIAAQQHPRWPEVDLSHIRLAINGGAACPPPVFEKFWARGVDFKTGFGLTESGPNTFWLPPEDVRRKPGSVGKPLFHVDCRVVDPDGRECGPGEVGELLIRGPQVVSGYWNRPEDTAKSIVNGWLYTGDLVRRDAEGYYFIVGRSKDMIISGGENIYPAEVEAVVSGHPAVAAVAVIGVPDEKWGEVGRAVVVPADGQRPEPEELLEYARQHLARYKVPKSVVYVDELPVTGAGKIDKIALKEKYGG